LFGSPDDLSRAATDAWFDGDKEIALMRQREAMILSGWDGSWETFDNPWQ